VKIREGVLVTGFELDGRRIKSVVTDHGTIGCEVVVNAAGIWAKRVGEMAGVAIAGGRGRASVCRDREENRHDAGNATFPRSRPHFYLKPDVRAFAIGGWEKGAPACWPAGVPFDFTRELLPENFDRFAPIVPGAAERMPILNEVGIRRSSTARSPSQRRRADHGLAPELDNFFVACGFTAASPLRVESGEAMSRWILDGDPGMDLWPFDVRRFSAQHANRHLPGGAELGVLRPILCDPLARRGVDVSARGAAKPGYEALKARGAATAPRQAGSVPCGSTRAKSPVRKRRA
jgi:4-methylaminobutanoate oxidase (formaldehyde-forming)